MPSIIIATDPTPPSRINPPFIKYIMRHSQNLPLTEYAPFSRTIILIDAPKILSFLPEYTPTPDSTTICDTPRIYLSLPDYVHFFNNYVRHSQNIPPPPPKIYPPFQQLKGTFTEYTSPSQNKSPFFNNYIRPS